MYDDPIVCVSKKVKLVRNVLPKSPPKCKLNHNRHGLVIGSGQMSNMDIRVSPPGLDDIQPMDGNKDYDKVPSVGPFANDIDDEAQGDESGDESSSNDIDDISGDIFSSNDVDVLPTFDELHGDGSGDTFSSNDVDVLPMIGEHGDVSGDIFSSNDVDVLPTFGAPYDPVFGVYISAGM